MEIFVSLLAVAIALSCLVALLLADARDARKKSAADQRSQNTKKI
jgi:hypothetical protein